MTVLAEVPTREDVLSFIFSASQYGNLGLFIGAGFSKAVLNTGKRSIALSWGELLEMTAAEMKVDFASLKQVGNSYPEIASALCRKYAAENKVSFAESLSVLKKTLCSLTSWYPVEPERSEFASYLEALNPSWIVTTNYDQVLECLLSGRSISLGPTDAFISPNDVIPILHLHGVRAASEQIVIVQEDYVALFRPTEYRQIRLALTMKESTTCIMGYGLGDVNVLTALDWSRNVYQKAYENYPHEVIQIVRTNNPKMKPYRSQEGMIIVEASEISSFCKEYVDVSLKFKAQERRRRRRVKQVIALLKKSEPVTVNMFIDNVSWRKRVLKALGNFSIELVAVFESFLETCFAETKRRSNKNGAFAEYATDLDITVDILTTFPNQRLPTVLFPVAAKNLNRLATYIGKGKGYSWAATDAWNARKTEFPSELIDELKIIARQYKYSSLENLIDEL